MANKIHSGGNGYFSFHCPGCKETHAFISGGDNPGRPQWQFNGDMEKPTFAPSLLVNKGQNNVCHSFVRDGRIEFLSDCYHELRGQTVDLPDWESW
jgi:hypothetical protein